MRWMPAARPIKIRLTAKPRTCRVPLADNNSQRGKVFCMSDDIFRIVVAVGVVVAALSFVVQAIVGIATLGAAKKMQQRVAALADKAEPVIARIGPVSIKSGPLWRRRFQYWTRRRWWSSGSVRLSTSSFPSSRKSVRSSTGRLYGGEIRSVVGEGLRLLVSDATRSCRRSTPGFRDIQASRRDRPVGPAAGGQVGELLTNVGERARTRSNRSTPRWDKQWSRSNR